MNNYAKISIILILTYWCCGCATSNSTRVPHDLSTPSAHAAGTTVASRQGATSGAWQAERIVFDDEESGHREGTKKLPPSQATSEPAAQTRTKEKENSAPSVKTIRNSMIRDYQNFLYQKTIRTADKLLRDDRATPHQKDEAGIMGGAAAYLRGEKEKSRRYFRGVLSRNPNVQIGRDMFPEALLQFFRGIKKSGGS